VSERALRPVALWRKDSIGSDSEAGCRFAERLLMVVPSRRLWGRPPLERRQPGRQPICQVANDGDRILPTARTAPVSPMCSTRRSKHRG